MESEDRKLGNGGTDAWARRRRVAVVRALVLRFGTRAHGRPLGPGVQGQHSQHHCAVADAPHIGRQAPGTPLDLSSTHAPKSRSGP